MLNLFSEDYKINEETIIIINNEVKNNFNLDNILSYSDIYVDIYFQHKSFRKNLKSGIL